MSEEGPVSLRALDREMRELQEDYASFLAAYEVIKKRVIASTELQPPRNPLLHTWSGTRAVCGALEMSLHAIERTIHEHDILIRKVHAGELGNSDEPPKLTVLDGGIT